MSKIKLPEDQQVGITEAGDPAFHLEIFDNLKRANIIITKRLTDQLIDKLVENKDKVILHLTVTGMGGTKLEPFVPPLQTTLEKAVKLCEKGFPPEHIVIRIDPIIPTPKGVTNAINVIHDFVKYLPDIKRYRWSSLDMYQHVKDRFTSIGAKVPYESFHAPQNYINGLYSMLEGIAKVNELELEACAEINQNSPCVSQKDLDILGITDIELVGSAEQRKGCHCPANKTELIKGKPTRCPNSCLYCFWKEDSSDKTQ